MIKKIVLMLLICVSAMQAMQKDQVIGTFLLTGSYYCAIEAYMQKYSQNASEEQRQKYRNCYLAGAALLQNSGLAMLSRTLLKSNTPLTTVGKFSMGAISMAEGLYLLKMAKLHYDLYKKNGHKAHESQAHQFLCGALLCGAFGSGMATWAMKDINHS